MEPAILYLDHHSNPCVGQFGKLSYSSFLQFVSSHTRCGVIRHKMFPGRLLPIIVFAEDDHWRAVGLDPAAIGGKGPLVGPTINPGGVIREQSETTVTGGISGQVILVEGDSPLIVEVKIPGQQPLMVDGTACRLRSPVGVIESLGRWRRFLSAADRAPAHEPAGLVGGEGLDAERNEDKLWNLADSLNSI